MHSRFTIQAAQIPDTVAVSNEKETVAYGRLSRWVERLRPLFRCEKGLPVVLISLPGGPRFTAVQLACMAEGAVAVPIPDRTSAREAAGYLQLIRPDWVVVPSVSAAEGLLETLPPGVAVLAMEGEAGERNGPFVSWAEVMEGGNVDPVRAGTPNLPPGTQLIQFTSGSTGTPKGILLTGDNIRAYLDNNAAYLLEFTGRSVFCPMPQFHAFGGTVVLEGLSVGSSIHLANRFVPGNDLARMEAAACEVLKCAPTYPRLLHQLGVLDREHLPELRTLVMGAAATDPELAATVRERFPEVEIILRYGLTETMGPITRLHLVPGGKALGSGWVGPPVPGVKVAEGLPRPGEGEPGEVRVSSGVVAAGRLLERDRWEPLAGPDGFFSTGDLGHRATDGDLFLRGRISAFIKSNGYRVNPFEIEELLRSHPGVGEAVVFGVPDPVAGERITAWVEPAAKADPPAIRDLFRLLRGNLVAYKVPQKVRVVEKIPRNAVGKVDRGKVVEQSFELIG
ncbi:MAG: class I adenylate-forming enzyme family protein, partial [Desulfococcaceae bacterium]